MQHCLAAAQASSNNYDTLRNMLRQADKSIKKHKNK